MACIACRIGLVWECRHEGRCNANSGDNELGTPERANGDDGEDVSNPPLLGGYGVPDFEDEEEVEFRTYKDDSTLRDQQSTGRKRAAKMFPLNEEDECEWKMKQNCGGGDTPIIGCLDGKQEARHHGPDKNTLNNDKGNVHRICHTCHNRWHTLNDEGYVPAKVYDLHSPRTATIVDIGLNEQFWIGRKVVKAKD